MLTQTYDLATRVFTGIGWLDATFGDRLAARGRRGVLVLGRGRAVSEARRADLVDRLRVAGAEVVVCDGIGPDGRLEELRAAARRVPADAAWVAAIGGGSVIDAAKLLALHRGGRPFLPDATSVADVARRLGDAQKRPVVAVPTCLGSGAEVSALAELLDERGWKEPVIDARLAPDEAWIDPAFVPSPPAAIQATSVVDLFCNLFDPLVSSAHRSSVQDRVAIELCRQLVALVAQNSDFRLADEVALELAWLGHLGVQPGLTRPRAPSVLHRIEHVVSPVVGCAHGEGLGWLLGPFLRRALGRGPAVARRLVELTAAVFGADGPPDRLVERWLAGLPLAWPAPSLGVHDIATLAHRTIEAYGHDDRLPGPLALRREDVEAILAEAVQGHARPIKHLGKAPVAHRVRASRVFGGAVDGHWHWLLLTPLPFVHDDLMAWRPDWTAGWYRTLRVEGAEQRGLVVQSGPGGQAALDALTLLARAGARFDTIHFVGLCGALRTDWAVGSRVRPTAAWGDRALRDHGGDALTALAPVDDTDPEAHLGICGSVSALTNETTDLLEAWRGCAIDVIDLEMFSVASYGRLTGTPVSADLVVSDHPLDGLPLWAAGTLPDTVRQRAVDLVARRVHAAAV